MSSQGAFGMARNMDHLDTLLPTLAALIEPVEVWLYGGPSLGTLTTKWSLRLQSKVRLM